MRNDIVLTAEERNIYEAEKKYFDEKANQPRNFLKKDSNSVKGEKRKTSKEKEITTFPPLTFGESGRIFKRSPTN
jgi:hypothetical protein